MHQNIVFFAGVLGLGGPEVIIILVIVMLLFGGKKLPELAKGLGKSVKEFKRATQEAEESLSEPTHRPSSTEPSAPAATSLAPAPVPASATQASVTAPAAAAPQPLRQG